MSTVETTEVHTGGDDPIDAPFEAPFEGRVLALITFLSNRLAAGAAAPIRRRFDLGITEGRALFMIGGSGRTTVSILARGIGIDKAAISRSVARMIDLGLVRSDPDPRHLSRNLLSLTDQGQGYHRTLNVYNLAREEALLEVLSADERADFTAMLVKLLHNIDLPNSLTMD